MERIENIADQSWDKTFREEPHILSKVEPNMKKLIGKLKAIGAKRVLDLGSGSGRHSVYLAEKGFEVYSLDVSNEGLRLTRQKIEGKGLEARLLRASAFDKLPFRDGFFDAVVSTQVIHHNYREKIKEAIAEIERVLRPGGIVYVTVASRKTARRAKMFKRVAKNTYIPLDGTEKGLPHFFYSKGSLMRDFGAFEKRSIELSGKGRKKLYCMTAKKPMPLPR